MSLFEESSITEGDAEKYKVISFVKATHAEIVSIFGHDEEILNDCLINLIAYTMRLYCIQYKHPDKIFKALLEELDRILFSVIKEKGKTYTDAEAERATHH